MRATFKSNHNGTLEGNFNTADQKYHLKNIKMTSYFEDVTTLLEVKEGGDIVWHLNSVKTEVPINFLENFYADKNLLIYFPAEIVDNVNRILAETNQLAHPFDYLKMEDEIKPDFSQEKVFDFESENFLDIWTAILKNINDYKVEELKYSQQIANAFTKSTDEGEKILAIFKLSTGNKKPPIPLKS